jgi:hypothetical protein
MARFSAVERGCEGSCFLLLCIFISEQKRRDREVQVRSCELLCVFLCSVVCMQSSQFFFYAFLHLRFLRFSSVSICDQTHVLMLAPIYSPYL